MRAQHRPLIVATGNPGKLREFIGLLAGLPFEILSYRDFGLAAPAETGSTFVENAVLKARNAARAGHAAAIADDSGLEVDALNGAPGVYSARFAGENADDSANNAKLLAALEGIPLEARSARYRCVLAFVDDEFDATPLIAEGVWEGRILDSPRGAGGFGYDAYFWLPTLGRTAAELEPAEKNLLSHRGAALRIMQARLTSRGRASVAP